MKWNEDIHYLCSLGITHRPVIARSRGHQQGCPSSCTRVVPAPGSGARSLLTGVRSAPVRPRHTSSRPWTRPSPPWARPFSLVNSASVHLLPPECLLLVCYPSRRPQVPACLLDFNGYQQALLMSLKFPILGGDLRRLRESSGIEP